jgi:hypothetical protein
VGKMQFEHCNTGAIQTNLTIPVIESTLIVVPPLEIQEEIAKQVMLSFNTEDESKNLLEEAKHRVEQIILGEENSKNDYSTSTQFPDRIKYALRIIWLYSEGDFSLRERFETKMQTQKWRTQKESVKTTG